MGELALAHARRGFALFPLAPNAKVPTEGSHGVYDATTDEEKIRALWEEHPRANIAFAGGDGLVFIDEDTYKGADLSDWNLPPTLTVRSARGGLHRYFHYDGVLPCVKEGILAPGVCIKAAGGYAVAPGSIFKGKRYEWVDEHQLIAELPERIAQMIRNATVRPKAEPAPRPTTLSAEYVLRNDDDASAYWLDQAMARTCDGQGDDIGYWLAQQLHIEARYGASVDVKATLREYAERATVNPRDPFDDGDVERWYTSAEKNRIVQFGTACRPRSGLRLMPPPAPEGSLHQEDAPPGDETPEAEIVQILRAENAELKAMVAERDATIAKLMEANVHLNQRIQLLRDTITHPALPPAARIVAAYLDREIERSPDDLDAKGRLTLYEMDKHAANCGMKVSMFSKSVKLGKEAGILHTGHVPTPTGNRLVTVGVTPNMRALGAWVKPASVKGGGGARDGAGRPRVCPECGSTHIRVKKKTTYVITCLDGCGVISEKVLREEEVPDTANAETEEGNIQLEYWSPTATAGEGSTATAEGADEGTNNQLEYHPAQHSNTDIPQCGSETVSNLKVTPPDPAILPIPHVAASATAPQDVRHERARLKHDLYEWAQTHDWGRLTYDKGAASTGGSEAAWGIFINQAGNVDLAKAWAALPPSAAAS